MIKRMLVGCALGLLAGMLFVENPCRAEEGNWFTDNFIDPEDGGLDVLLGSDRGGFISLPIIITEPTVDNGIGLAGVFIHGADDEESLPDVSGFAGAYTGNDSWLYAGFHQGSYFEDRLRYTGAIGQTSLNLDLYPGTESDNLSYNMEGVFSYQEARYRLGNSGFFAGGSWIYFDSDVTFRGGAAAPPDISPGSLNATLSGLGLVLSYDDRDNIFTPTNGIDARATITKYDEAWGSSFDYLSFELTALGYHSPDDKWTLGAKGTLNVVGDDAPFFAEPYIDLRGIPALRYQGEAVVSAEFEARRMISSRWSLLGFTGVGFAGADGLGDLDDEGPQGVFGAGVRYLVARKYGMHVGVDVAQGPEDTVLYLQFGNAW